MGAKNSHDQPDAERVDTVQGHASQNGRSKETSATRERKETGRNKTDKANITTKGDVSKKENRVETIDGVVKTKAENNKRDQSSIGGGSKILSSVKPSVQSWQSNSVNSNIVLHQNAKFFENNTNSMGGLCYIPTTTSVGDTYFQTAFKDENKQHLGVDFTLTPEYLQSVVPSMGSVIHLGQQFSYNQGHFPIDNCSTSIFTSGVDTRNNELTREVPSRDKDGFREKSRSNEKGTGKVDTSGKSPLRKKNNDELHGGKVWKSEEGTREAKSDTNRIINGNVLPSSVELTCLKQARQKHVPGKCHNYEPNGNQGAAGLSKNKPGHVVSVNEPRARAAAAATSPSKGTKYKAGKEGDKNVRKTKISTSEEVSRNKEKPLGENIGLPRSMTCKGLDSLTKSRRNEFGDCTFIADKNPKTKEKQFSNKDSAQLNVAASLYLDSTTSDVLKAKKINVRKKCRLSNVRDRSSEKKKQPVSNTNKTSSDLTKSSNPKRNKSSGKSQKKKSNSPPENTDNSGIDVGRKRGQKDIRVPLNDNQSRPEYQRKVTHSREARTRIQQSRTRQTNSTPIPDTTPANKDSTPAVKNRRGSTKRLMTNGSKFANTYIASKVINLSEYESKSDLNIQDELDQTPNKTQSGRPSAPSMKNLPSGDIAFETVQSATNPSFSKYTSNSIPLGPANNQTYACYNVAVHCPKVYENDPPTRKSVTESREVPGRTANTPEEGVATRNAVTLNVSESRTRGKDSRSRRQACATKESDGPLRSGQRNSSNRKSVRESETCNEASSSRKYLPTSKANVDDGARVANEESAPRRSACVSRGNAKEHKSHIQDSSNPKSVCESADIKRDSKHDPPNRKCIRASNANVSDSTKHDHEVSNRRTSRVSVNNYNNHEKRTANPRTSPNSCTKMSETKPQNSALPNQSKSGEKTIERPTKEEPSRRSEERMPQVSVTHDSATHQQRADVHESSSKISPTGRNARVELESTKVQMKVALQVEKKIVTADNPHANGDISVVFHTKEFSSDHSAHGICGAMPNDDYRQQAPNGKRPESGTTSTGIRAVHPASCSPTQNPCRGDAETGQHSRTCRCQRPDPANQQIVYTAWHADMLRNRCAVIQPGRCPPQGSNMPPDLDQNRAPDPRHTNPTDKSRSQSRPYAAEKTPPVPQQQQNQHPPCGSGCRSTSGQQQQPSPRCFHCSPRFPCCAGVSPCRRNRTSLLMAARTYPEPSTSMSSFGSTKVKSVGKLVKMFEKKTYVYTPVDGAPLSWGDPNCGGLAVDRSPSPPCSDVKPASHFDQAPYCGGQLRSKPRNVHKVVVNGVSSTGSEYPVVPGGECLVQVAFQPSSTNHIGAGYREDSDTNAEQNYAMQPRYNQNQSRHDDYVDTQWNDTEQVYDTDDTMPGYKYVGQDSYQNLRERHRATAMHHDDQVYDSEDAQHERYSPRTRCEAHPASMPHDAMMHGPRSSARGAHPGQARQPWDELDKRVDRVAHGPVNPCCGGGRAASRSIERNRNPALRYEDRGNFSPAENPHSNNFVDPHQNHRHQERSQSAVPRDHRRGGGAIYPAPPVDYLLPGKCRRCTPTRGAHQSQPAGHASRPIASPEYGTTSPAATGGCAAARQLHAQQQRGGEQVPNCSCAQCQLPQLQQVGGGWGGVETKISKRGGSRCRNTDVTAMGQPQQQQQHSSQLTGGWTGVCTRRSRPPSTAGSQCSRPETTAGRCQNKNPSNSAVYPPPQQRAGGWAAGGVGCGVAGRSASSGSRRCAKAVAQKSSPLECVLMQKQQQQQRLQQQYQQQQQQHRDKSGGGCSNYMKPTSSQSQSGRRGVATSAGQEADVRKPLKSILKKLPKSEQVQDQERCACHQCHMTYGQQRCQNHNASQQPGRQEFACRST